MDGKKLFNRAVYEVIQELFVQQSISHKKPFDYSPQFRGNVAEYADPSEQIDILYLLQDKNILKLRSVERGDPPLPYLQVTTSPKSLHDFMKQLEAGAVIDKNSDVKSGERIECSIRLDDLNIMLKIGDFSEKSVGRLHEGRAPHALMVALQHAPKGAVLHHARIFESASYKNLWQIMTKSSYGYLSPFFIRPSAGEIGLKENVRLSRKELANLVSKINEIYRNNFVDTLDELQR